MDPNSHATSACTLEQQGLSRMCSHYHQIPIRPAYPSPSTLYPKVLLLFKDAHSNDEYNDAKKAPAPHHVPSMYTSEATSDSGPYILRSACGLHCWLNPEGHNRP